MRDCPDETTLGDFLEGRLSEEALGVKAHKELQKVVAWQRREARR
jgi:hypothetical protein